MEGEEQVAKKPRVDDDDENRGDEIIIDDMEKDLDSPKAYILQTLSSGHAEACWWDILSNAWKSDPEIAMTALRKHLIKGHQLPENLKNDRSFMMEAIQVVPTTWLALPDHFAKDPVFARAIRLFSRGDEQLMGTVFARHPELRDDRKYWLNIVNGKASGKTIYTLLDTHAGTNILANEEIMLKGITINKTSVALVDESLFQRENFLESVVEKLGDGWTYVLEHIPRSAQVRFPHLMERMLASNDAFQYLYPNSRQHSLIVDRFAPELWSRRSFVEAWFAAGGTFLADKFPQEWKDDRAIFSLIARHARGLERIQAFEEASANLKSDKGFMIRVLSFQHGRLYFSASEALQKDFDVVVAALASSEEFNPNGSRTDSTVAEFLANNQYNDFVEHVRSRLGSQLEAHANFFELVLPAMTYGEGSCHLPLLNHEAFKLLIAEYLDVPLGARLDRARAAFDKLPDDDEIESFFASDDESSDYDYNPYFNFMGGGDY